MEYKVLYRKYRPTNFDELVGQSNIKKILQNSIINNKIAHAYIFTGPRGTGKTSTAKIFAKALNCEKIKNGISCEECVNCTNFHYSPDILEMDAASNNSVDDIRNIIENINIAPTMGKYKIYIIDEVHMLTTQAWNAFLKTLEEPPSNVIFILATTDIQKVPVTVLSRCQRFDFQRIDRKLISENIKRICDLENINIDDESITEISYLSDGCMRDALSILDQLSKVSDNVNLEVLKESYGTVTNNEIEMIYSYILKNDIDGLINDIVNIKNSGIDIKVFITKMIDVLLEKAIMIKKKNISNLAFNQLKKIINSLNMITTKLSSEIDGFLLLEVELISFINSDEQPISKREVNQIISREIISDNSSVEKILTENKQVYNVCDEFINIRINNTFVDANKDSKISASNVWNKFKEVVSSENLVEYKTLIQSSMVQVASNDKIIFVTSSESMKIVGNSKLFEIETKISSLSNSKYSIIFISKKDWDEFMKSYDKNKKYEMMDETKYVNEDTNIVKSAEDIFGDKVSVG